MLSRETSNGEPNSQCHLLSDKQDTWIHTCSLNFFVM